MAYSIPYNVLYEGQQAEEYKARKAKEKEENNPSNDAFKHMMRDSRKSEKAIKDKDTDRIKEIQGTGYDAGREISKRFKKDIEKEMKDKGLKAGFKFAANPGTDYSAKATRDTLAAADAIDRHKRRHPGEYKGHNNIIDRAAKSATYKATKKYIDRAMAANENCGIFETVQFI